MEEEIRELREMVNVLSYHVFNHLSNKMKTPWTYELARKRYYESKKIKEVEKEDDKNTPREIVID